MNEERLKPVTETPNSKLPKKPPRRAPTTPKIIAPKIPPLAGLGSMRLAITPTISPNNIQAIIFILYASPPLSRR